MGEATQRKTRTKPLSARVGMIWRYVVLNHCQYSVLKCSFMPITAWRDLKSGTLTGEGRYAYLPYGRETGLQSLFEDL